MQAKDHYVMFWPAYTYIYCLSEPYQSAIENHMTQKRYMCSSLVKINIDKKLQFGNIHYRYMYIVNLVLDHDKFDWTDINYIV